MTIHRRTLSSAARLSGAGLFTGHVGDCCIRPDVPGAGIQFRRTDLPDNLMIPARIEHLFQGAIHPAFEHLPSRNTSLVIPGTDHLGVATVEHVLSALAGLGITDARIDISFNEIPIDDGSAKSITDRLLDAGMTEHPVLLEPMVLARPLVVSDASGARIEAAPADHPHYTYHLDYGAGSPIGAQSASWSGDPDDYAQNIAPARTFCLEEEGRAMQALGLFQALTARDLLVFGPHGPIDNTLRFENEPARHKLLDLIGDLSLAGRPIRARITATRSGHALNHEMARLLASL